MKFNMPLVCLATISSSYTQGFVFIPYNLTKNIVLKLNFNTQQGVKKFIYNIEHVSLPIMLDISVIRIVNNIKPFNRCISLQKMFYFKNTEEEDINYCKEYNYNKVVKFMPSLANKINKNDSTVISLAYISNGNFKRTICIPSNMKHCENIDLIFKIKNNERKFTYKIEVISPSILLDNSLIAIINHNTIFSKCINLQSMFFDTEKISEEYAGCNNPDFVEYRKAVYNKYRELAPLLSDTIIENLIFDEW